MDASRSAVNRHLPVARALLLLLASLSGPARAAAVEGGPKSGAPGDLLAEVDGLVREHFYAPATLGAVGWEAQVARARAAWTAAPEGEPRAAVIRALLATLHASHTELYTRREPAYWDLASIFEPVLQRNCAAERTPGFPVATEAIGVFWKELDGRWFVGGLYAGGPAERAGLLVGDEVVIAAGQPFGPVVSFAGRAGAEVALELRRVRGGPLLRLAVTPERVRPTEAMQKAVEGSFRIEARHGKRIAYQRLWSWTPPTMQQALLGGIVRANAEAVDGFVLDLRDGWGGAHAHYLGVFMQEVPVLEGLPRQGPPERYDYRIPRPTAVLINQGTRSGKETIAHGVRRHHLARLVGQNTAGAVVFGRPFCLSDGSLLLLAVQGARVDGEVLEGRGVPPDVEVPWDPRWAGGQDPQLERALELLTAP